jgi:hypothetical protein
MKKICCQTVIFICIISFMNINLFANAKSKDPGGSLTIQELDNPPYYTGESYNFEFEIDDDDVTLEDEDKKFSSVIEQGDDISGYTYVSFGLKHDKEESMDFDLLSYRYTGTVDYRYDIGDNSYHGDWETDKLYDEGAVSENIIRSNYALTKNTEAINNGEVKIGEIQNEQEDIEENKNNISSESENIIKDIEDDLNKKEAQFLERLNYLRSLTYTEYREKYSDEYGGLDAAKNNLISKQEIEKKQLKDEKEKIKADMAEKLQEQDENYKKTEKQIKDLETVWAFNDSFFPEVEEVFDYFDAI